MERRNVALNGIATNAHLSAMASCNLHDEAFEAYDKMRAQRLSPDLHTFGTLLQAASKDVQGGLEKAQAVWSELSTRRDVVPDVLCYNLLLLCMREAGIPSSMRKPLPEEREDGTTKATRTRKVVSSPPRGVLAASAKEVATFALPSGHKIHLCLGKWGERWLTAEDTLGLLAAVKKAGLEPDVKTFSLLVGLSLDTECVLKAMEEAGVTPDRKFWIATIRSLALRGNLQGARVSGVAAARVRVTRTCALGCEGVWIYKALL